MANTLYIQPSSGVAGDMFLSALCSLCDAWDDIQALPKKLALHDGQVEVQTLDKNGIVCKHVNIIDTGHQHAAHSHAAKSGHAAHAHRHLRDILTLIEKAEIPAGAKAIAKDIFTIIGESESRIHGISIEKIHFHEVSGVDSILDIVGCALLLDRLKLSRCYCDPICVGYGEVDTQHGRLPVPAPATADILKGLPTYKGNESGERATPTGAAIIKYLNPSFDPPPLAATAIAYGPGKKDFKSANVLRLSLLDLASSDEQVWQIETNLDDATPESLGEDLQNKLLELGALDFYLAPIQMKKARPGILLSVLTPEGKRDAVAEAILEHTPAIGLRFFPVKRKTLPRESILVETEFGPVAAKQVTRPSGLKTRKFEHDALKDIATRQNISLIELKQRLGEH